MSYYSDFPNRTLCAVLEDMRKCFETRNFTPMIGLIEEAQIMGNKMEAGLGDKADVKRYAEDRRRLIKEIRVLEKKKKALK